MDVCTIFPCFQPARVKPNYASIQPKSAGCINRLGQYVSSPGKRAYCHTELDFSYLAVAITIASTHSADPRRDGQAELAWVAW